MGDEEISGNYYGGANSVSQFDGDLDMVYVQAGWSVGLTRKQ